MSSASKALFTIDRRGAAIYRQVYDRIRKAILSGSLAPGAKLPSSRGLAAQLGTARGTIDAAYGLLANEGYVVTRRAGGTLVQPNLNSEARQSLQRRASNRANNSGQLAPENSAALGLFQMGVPALDAFPRKNWSRLVTRHARNYSTLTETHPNALGTLQLRRALVSYLGLSRGIDCSIEQIIITAGFQGALGLIAHALVRPGDQAWMEEPGYFLTRQALAAAGVKVAPIRVDAEGIDVQSGTRRAPRARFAVVTPAHQSPLGMALSLVRRLALLDWATDAQAWIIEDDYDSEFHYLGPPLPALKSLDQNGRVLYVGTFSKVLFPALRLGYLVVPDGEAGRFARVAAGLNPAPSPLTQMVVADFMQQGHFARHVKRMRDLYADRRTALARSLGDVFGNRLSIDLHAGGMHLLAWPKGVESDLVLVERARRRGLAPAPLSLFSATGKYPAGLLLGFANLPAGIAGIAARKLRAALVCER